MSAPATAAAPALQVFVACGSWVLALPTASVEQLLLAEEGRLRSADTWPDVSAHLGVLAHGDASYSAWDLGLLLGLAPQFEAWVLLRIARPQGPLPLALRTGSCLSTGLLETAPPAGGQSRASAQLVPLPTTLAHARTGALSAAFLTPSTSRARSAERPVGLAVELDRLWTEAELVSAEAALRALCPDAP